MLARLSGRWHQVLSAGGVASANGKCTCTGVAQRGAIPDSEPSGECALYWDKRGEPCDKAGAYAIQGLLEARRVAGLRGSYSGVVVLPLFETAVPTRAAGRSRRTVWGSVAGVRA